MMGMKPKLKPVAPDNDAWKAYTRERLRMWADYINMLRVREIAKPSTVSSFHDEAVHYRRHKKDLEKQYPYQPYIYQCVACEKPYLKKPEDGRCIKCGRYVFTLIREGVTGKRVFASMIHGTGRVKDWQRERIIDEIVKKLPDHYYRVVKMRYCDDYMSQPEMARAEGMTLTTFQKVLYEGECMFYGIMMAHEER